MSPSSSSWAPSPSTGIVGWKFLHSPTTPDGVTYSLRPDNESEDLEELRHWVLPVANEFIADADQHFKRPDSEPQVHIEYVADGYYDGNWTSVTVLHDWAITGDFVGLSEVAGYMGSLPVRGVGWYRQKLSFTRDDSEKSIYLDVEGAMAFSMVWLNGHLVGGWPNGYVTFRLDLTPCVKFGEENYLAIRAENPQSKKFSRWYPGAGIYRDVWVIKVPITHVAHYGSHITTRDVSAKSATVDLSITIDNKDTKHHQPVNVFTKVYKYKDGRVGQKEPNMYIAITKLYDLENRLLDEYETNFGIRTLKFDANNGLFINGEHIYIQGVNQHHDLGALGAAWNLRAGTRQLEMLKELGVNAIRMAHNPPTPELLRLTDEMGFMVIDGIFDCWLEGKSASDFHLIFEDWHEPDIRSFVHGPPAAGKIFSELHDIVLEEDGTRSVTSSLFRAIANDSITGEMDIISLNYQGEGMRYGGAYAHLTGNRILPQYDNFHAANPDSLIIGSEVTWSLSSRGSFHFPVSPYISAPVNDTNGGGNSSTYEITAYEVYSSESGSTPDRVFYTQDTKPSYSGIIDLAGFKKERFYLYQSRWRSDFPAAHIVPHWNWPERVGQVIPVHVFTSGDEAELFVNGRSQGKQKKEPLAYRFRWDDVVYEPGEVKVVVYKDGKQWSTDNVVTTGEAAALRLSADRTTITADGEDLTFITAEVVDSNGNVVPTANNAIQFDVSSPGVIVATDNGFPGDLTKFPSTKRNALNGLALAIVRS
ncbi:hypothetical protein V502_00311 [Pseudogymnoascus sp. VKM F-4520 (FW-2644)]|nr:hypothetical protein V502_00311 [Pseudogymnoascus sp. VKM F-4520 (FW-2644)]